MKRILLITSMFLCIAVLSVNAQVSLGIAGGSNFSTTKITNIDHLNPSIRAGYFVSLIPKFKLGKYSINTEVGYSLEGYNTEPTVTYIGMTKNKFHYIRVIPEFEYHPIKSLGLYAGVNLGIKVQEAMNIGTGWRNTTDLDIIKNADLGLTAGARAYFSKFFVMVGYNYGLRDIDNSSYTDIEGNDINGVKMYNRNIQVGIGYTFL